MSSSNVIHVPRETQEFIVVDLRIDGTQITSGLEISITPGDSRPTIWTPATTLAGKTGLPIAGFAPGDYTVWARITQNEETPVRMAGILIIT